MGTLFDYIDWRGDLLFSEADFNEVDNLILTQISYVDLEGIVPSDFDRTPITLLDATRRYLRRHKGEIPYLGKILPPEMVSLMAKAAKSRRFSEVQLLGYTNKIDDQAQSQFSAMTFILDSGSSYIAYRGTDDTLVGWKENFNMSFMQPVPAQLEATYYLEKAVSFLLGNFYVGGHSKGGNLAVYAAVCCAPELKDRILTVYNNDGPGFDTNFIESTEYKNIRGKIRTIVPHSSVVGMLLEHEENYEVVKSNAAGIMQHYGLSWEVLGGKFIHLDTVTNESKLIDSTLKAWLNEMTAEERERFVDSIYETLSATDAKTLTELSMEKIKLVKAWGTLDSKAKSVIRKCMSLLLKQTAQSLRKK